MSHLVARILLAVFLIPFSAIIYLLAFIFCSRQQHSDVTAFVAAGLVSWAFIAAYWVLLWMGTVRWTSWRIAGTLVEAAVIGIAGVVLAIFADMLLPFSRGSFGAFCGSIFVPIAWLIATVFLWRETAMERRLRLAATSDLAVSCPACGYNLTGLTATRCPECGKQCTLDELFAAQGELRTAEVEE